MSLHFEFPPGVLPPAAETVRKEVRAFLDEERAAGRFPEPDGILAATSRDFSRRCGERGYIGMTWPKRYGGAARSALERYVMIEEFIAAGAPARLHWTADRQSGPVILRYGTDAQKDFYLPRITKGECFFCIGLSEPNSGSDLASVQTRARRDGDDWVVNGTKLWTTNAHNAHYMIALLRTKPQDMADRYHGLTQMIIDLKSPGVTIRPVINLAGEHDFNEVVFEDVRVPADNVVGTPDEGWKQASAELAYERSGPERWLSTFRLLAELNAVCGQRLERAHRQQLGRLFAHLLTLREMSLSIAGMLENGKTPNQEASIVKDIGTTFEREVIATARELVAEVDPGPEGARLRRLLDSATLYGPAFTIRGGATEILRGTIARGLGLR